MALVLGKRVAQPFRQTRQSVVSILLVTFTLLFAILSATATAVLGETAGLAICMLLIGGALLTSPRATMWVTVVGGLGVAGLVELYLPDLQAIRWVFASLSIWLAVVSLVQWLGKRREVDTWIVGANALAVALVLFVLAVVLSTISGGMSIANAVVGLKNYFQMWGLILALAWLGYKPHEARRFIHFLGLLALVQMPFVLHQFLVLVPQRSNAVDAAHNIVAVDVVAGTFGGSMTGGGRSSDLALLVALALTLFFTQWQASMRRLASTITFSLLAFAPILLNEAKLALVLVPIGLFLIFRSTIIQRPFAWLLGALTVVAATALVIVGYSNLPGADSQESTSLGSYIESSISYNVGEQGYGGAVLNRTTVYRFWLTEHWRTGDVLHAVLGHGPGFSNDIAIRRGDNPAAQRYLGFFIGLTGLSTLLWDTGLLGTGLFALVLLAAYRFAGNLCQQWQGTPIEPAVKTAQISTVLLATSLTVINYVAFDVGFQTMFAVMLGFLFAIAQSPSGAAS